MHIVIVALQGSNSKKLNSKYVGRGMAPKGCDI